MAAPSVAYQVDLIQSGAPSSGSFEPYGGAQGATEAEACGAAESAVDSWAAGFGASLGAFNGVVDYLGGRYCSWTFIDGPYPIMYAARVVEVEVEEPPVGGSAGGMAICQGSIVTDADGVAACLGAGGDPIPWTSQPAFAIQDLDPVIASGAFGAGFFVMAMGWAVSRGLRLVLDMLK